MLCDLRAGAELLRFVAYPLPFWGGAFVAAG